LLTADTSINCLTWPYLWYSGLATLIVILVVIGVPLMLLVVLLHEGRRHSQLYNEALATVNGNIDQLTSERLTLGGGAEPGTAAEYRYGQLYPKYEFCIKDFRPECFWFEPVDMLRKLALSGLLIFVRPGSGAQVLCGCVIAVGSLTLQVGLAPYAEPEANALKALVDWQIFLTFLICFILRYLAAGDGKFEADEPLGIDSHDYDTLLACSIWAVIAAAAGLIVHKLVRERVRTYTTLAVGMDTFRRMTPSRSWRHRPSAIGAHEPVPSDDGGSDASREVNPILPAASSDCASSRLEPVLVEPVLDSEPAPRDTGPISRLSMSATV
jgi:hypothetical protein